MTHGEEPGSETHQDSAVLTYLEGLLMHQVAGGPGATGARRTEVIGREVQEPRALPLRSDSHGSAHQEQDQQDQRAGGTSQHLRKARLLRSEAWAGKLEVEGLREAEPTLNGRSGEQHHHGGALEGSPKCKGAESTLLASLLQSFSSRLQTVALSQQIVQNLKPPEPAALDQGSNGDTAEPRPCLGAASSRLKGFLKKSKMQNHSSSVPYRRRNVPERTAESPQLLTAGGKGTTVATATSASDSLSCAARLKAVASLVNTRSSPAPSPSPRPSVACSQLALLLSSEAHLQQYSREQALKAQLSGRSASERLAAMATHQSQHDLGKPPQPAPGVLGSFSPRNGTLSPPGRGTGGGTTSPRRTPQPLKERRGFDRSSARPSQNCSSLLLHLLNNHNAQKRANGHVGPGEAHRPCPSRGSPLLSDSEFSNPETSLPRDSSDTDSSCSSSSPIDLSIRSRVARALPASSSSSAPSSSSSSSSLDKLTESLINRWRPENPAPVAEEQEAEMGSLVRPHHKVTLLQLLLDHRNGEGKRARTSPDNPDSRQGLGPPLGRVAARLGPTVGAPAGRLTSASRGEDNTTRSPHGGPVSRVFQAPPSFPPQQDSNSTMSQYSQCPPTPAQSTPLNLCKSEAPSNPDTDSQDPAFTASKLLQNLAQCGLQSSAPSSAALNTPLPPAQLRADAPVTLLERLNTPILRNGTPVSDMPLSLIMSNGSPASDTPRTSLTSPPSEIESLLERRTVLQLLLGAAGSKEKPSAGSGRRKRPVCGGGPSEQRPNELSRCSNSPDFKIKVEPSEDGLAGPDSEDVKPTLASPGARDGLLSQLLKQQCRNLPVNTPTAGLMSITASVKEEPNELQAPPINPRTPLSEPRTPPSEPQAPPIPKKRRVCLEDFSQERPVSTAGAKSGSDARPFVSRSPERLATQNGGSPAEVNSPSSGCMGNYPRAEARGSFNVLKQLLLSDNCLKDLSQLQPGGPPSPLHPSEGRLNGTPPSGRPVPSHRDHPHSAPPPWGARDSPKVNLVPVKRKEAEGPLRWVVGVEESPDQHPDSPRLTKANPILYYMLQKGNSYLGREGRALRGGLCLGGAQALPRVKEEPAAHAEDHDFKLNTKHYLDQPEGAPEGPADRLNGSLKKC